MNSVEQERLSQPKDEMYNKRLYTYIVRFEETVFSISANSSEDANTLLKQTIETQLIPELKKLERVISCEIKLVSIQDLQTFGKNIKMPPTSTIQFVEMSTKEKITNEENLISLLKDRGYDITKKQKN